MSVYLKLLRKHDSIRRKEITVVEKNGIKKKKTQFHGCFISISREKIRFGDALMLNKSLIWRERAIAILTEGLRVLYALKSVEELGFG